MPIYRFQIESPLSASVVLQRLRGLIRERPTFWRAFKEAFGKRSPGTPPFIGQVEGYRFLVYRDIRYRNSFLPRVSGHVVSRENGAEIKVTMSLHPVVAVFVLFWLGAVGCGAVAMATHQDWNEAMIPIGMFVFGVALVLGGFFPEAIKARRLLERELADRNTVDEKD